MKKGRFSRLFCASFCCVRWKVKYRVQHRHRYVLNRTTCKRDPKRQNGSAPRKCAGASNAGTHRAEVPTPQRDQARVVIDDNAATTRNKKRFRQPGSRKRTLLSLPVETEQNNVEAEHDVGYDDERR
jgi:hypothetical protein